MGLQRVEEERKKNKREKKRVVALVGGKWRKRWFGVRQGKWVGRRLGR